MQQLILYFLLVFAANSLQIASNSSFLQAICNIANFLGTCFDIAKKHCKYIANFLHSQQNLKNAIFAGRFAKNLQCICKKFAMQQLILYFLLVFVANSLQIACVSFIFQWFLLQIAAKMKNWKLFASYLQQKPAKSIELAAALQFFCKYIAIFLQTFQEKLHF